MDREEEIRLIAYRIWEEEGRAQGRAFDQWVKAEAIWEAEHRPASYDDMMAAPAATPVTETPAGDTAAVPESAPRPKTRPAARRTVRRTVKKPPETGESSANS